MTDDDAATLAIPRFGTSNPEAAHNDVWTEIKRNGWNAYQARQELQQRTGRPIKRSGPFWSWERFGRTTTTLPDGRIVHVAGEHEDHYDPDFCIYNDVTVEHPDGRLEFFIYPRDVFPPTDFHTATLAGDRIVLIGSLGYPQERNPGSTQVLLLDTTTFAISPAPASARSGICPGWISRHTAEKINNETILVVGGKLATAKDYVDNHRQWKLDLTTWTWSEVQPGDQSIFPFSNAEYLTLRNPRLGTSNPERIDNPFWLEMARRRWPPSRVRAHYADIAVDTIEREREEVVWTLQRNHAESVTLPDGRHMTIGGKVERHGNEWADTWTYADIIVKDPTGQHEIYIYPDDTFPTMMPLSARAVGNTLYVFGWPENRVDLRKAGTPAIFAVDLESYRIEHCDAGRPPLWPTLYPGAAELRDGAIAFVATRKTEADPFAYVLFDPATRRWREQPL
ncbi:MAG: hypothetical protein R3D67_01715 [Hyphomicrobiaceae bacterium]